MHEYHSIQESLHKHFRVVKGRGGINHPFNNAVERARTTIIDQKWTFGRWCGYLSGIPPSEIHRIVSVSEKTKNPGKHFNWLVKEYRKKIETTQNVAQQTLC